MRPGAIFSLLMTELEPLPFLGDIMFLSLSRSLWQNGHAAIAVLEEFVEEQPMRGRMLAITDMGRALLRGEQNWLTLSHEKSGYERYVGGVRITPGQQNWHWVAEDRGPLLL